MPSVNMARGVEFEMGWRFKTAPITPKNLTDYKVLVQIRPYKDSDEVYASFNTTSSEITFTPLNGAVDLLIPASITSQFVFKNNKAVIDCWVYDDLFVDGERSPTYDIILNQGVSRL